MDHEDEFDAARGILTGAVLSLGLVCEHLAGCQSPEACEQAEEDRRRRSTLRDLILAAAALLAVLGTLALINWRA